jgi:hypothetical protein
MSPSYNIDNVKKIYTILVQLCQGISCQSKNSK